VRRAPGPVLNPTEQLSREYAARVDARDWDGAAALFTEDGVLVVPDPPEHLGPVRAHHGWAAIRDAFAELEATDCTRHEILAFESDDRIAGLAHHVMGDRCIDWHLHYVDTYAESSGGWLIARRELHVDRVETHPLRPG
jgi:ketosteroid isomerase-like protein